MLKIVLKILKLDNITVFNNAITNNLKKVNIVWKGVDNIKLTGMTHIAGKNENTSETIKVNGITIDSFVFNNSNIKSVGFIKMDIEGAELLALKGAIKTIDKYKPIIFMELCHKHLARYKYTDDDVFNYIYKLKYKIYQFLNSESLVVVEVNKANYKRCDDLLLIPEECSLLIQEGRIINAKR